MSADKEQLHGKVVSDRNINKDKGLYKNPIVMIKDNIVFTNKSVWAYYILAEKPYDFLSHQSKYKLANSTIQALSAIARRGDQSVDCHLLITTVPFNVENWITQVEETYGSWQETRNEVSKRDPRVPPIDDTPFINYVNSVADDLYTTDYRKRITLLGVKLFTRGAASFDSGLLDLGMKEMWSLLKGSIANIFHVPDENISNKEHEKATKAENNLFQVLGVGDLRAVRPTAEEILMTVKQRYYPGLVTPYLEVDHDNRIGLNDIITETGGEIQVNPRTIRFNHLINGEEYNGYRSTVTITKFPKHMTIPSFTEPFFNKVHMLDYNCYARFILVPTEEMKKKFQKKKLEADDELKNLGESGQRATTGIQETFDDLQTMENVMEGNNNPWVMGSYRITIDGQSEDEVNKAYSALKQAYKEDNLEINLTSGDQLALFREEQIGGEIEIKDFQHITDLSILAASGFNHGGYVGDPIAKEGS